MKNKKLPSIVSLMILTAITSVFWIMFSVYRSFTSEPEPVVPDEVINQLSPRLDTQTIDLMQNKIYP